MNNLKYIVIGSYRSGTTVVNESLEKHPELKVAYEIFHQELEPRGLPQSDELLLKLYGKKNFDFINTVYPKYLSKAYWYQTLHIDKNFELENYVKYVFSNYNGFKILYHQLSLESKIWNYFLENDIKFIHLVRENFLDIYVSFYATRITKIWQTLNSQKTNLIKPFEVKPEMLSNFFEMLSFLHDHFSYFLKNKEVLTIHYHDIKNWDQTSESIQKFLGIKNQKITTKYQKTIKQNKKNLISNYKELREYFKKTKWSKFFDSKEFI